MFFRRRRDRRLREWARAEVEPWTHRPGRRDAYAAFLADLNARHRDISILDLDGPEVSVRPKTHPHVQLTDGGQDALRLRDYVALFANCLKRSAAPMRMSLAISTGDTVDFPADHPIFCLQKRRGAATLLMPDVDFANFGYYEDAFRDRPFREKADQVIFCGSSTGRLFSEEDAMSDRGDRLSLARRFHGRSDIVVRIGAAVQCTTERGADILRSKPYFEAIPWSEQLRRRYVLSIDGNGATCSRVVLTLRSQSVLLKYRSDERLYYFHGLRPMEHYVPIADAEDLELKLAALRSGAIDAARIVRNANAFFDQYLRREAVETYLLHLLQAFQSGYLAKLTG